ncbi:MAG: CvpA family protein, partial [Desulfobacteraceae bacterium]
MNVLDIAILVLMAVLVLRGVLRGFVAEVASLAGVVLGILAGIRLMPKVTELLRPYLSGFSYLQILSFGLVFIGVLVACALVGRALRLLFRKTALGWLDRTLGAGLAVVKGVVLTYLALVVLTVYATPSTPLIASSRLA